jgi:hypothetical protein
MNTEQVADECSNGRPAKQNTPEIGLVTEKIALPGQIVRQQNKGKEEQE